MNGGDQQRTVLKSVRVRMFGVTEKKKQIQVSHSSRKIVFAICSSWSTSSRSGIPRMRYVSLSRMAHRYDLSSVWITLTNSSFFLNHYFRFYYLVCVCMNVA